MDDNNGFILPEVPDLTPKIEELPKHVRKFEPDYKYITKDALKSITVSQLAKLEADLHTLRLLYLLNGENDNLLLPDGRSVVAEINLKIEILNRMSEYFESIFTDNEGVE